jgi:hypothetical protein
MAYKSFGKKKSFEEWESEAGLSLIKGFAIEATRFKDIADRMEIAESTLYEWRSKSEDINNALSLGNKEGIAVIEGLNFQNALDGDNFAVERIYKYKIAPERIRREKEEEAKSLIKRREKILKKIDINNTEEIRKQVIQTTLSTYLDTGISDELRMKYGETLVKLLGIVPDENINNSLADCVISAYEKRKATAENE